MIKVFFNWIELNVSYWVFRIEDFLLHIFALGGFVKACPVGLTGRISQADWAGLDKALRDENFE